jgi:hypothetical protein
MRSVNLHAPWIRTIYLVTAGQVPSWLLPSHPRVIVVDQRDLFDDPFHELPTFNSLAIESVLHRIPNLSQRFLYFNNDCFLGRDVGLSTFWDRKQHTYFLFHDWSIDRSLQTQLDLIRVSPHRHKIQKLLPCYQPSGVLGVTFPAECFDNIMFFHDHQLSQRVWHQPVTHWFAHTPHLWVRDDMYAIEAALASELSVSRRNRFRTLRSDINMHLQYEARLKSARHRDARHVNVKSIDVATWGGMWPGTSTRERFYRPFAFQECHDPHKIATFWAQIACHLSTRAAIFITIDDDLPSNASPDCIKQHRSYFYRLMQELWTRPAPWENTAMVAQLTLTATGAAYSKPLLEDPAIQAVLQRGELNCDCVHVQLYDGKLFPRKTWRC